MKKLSKVDQEVLRALSEGLADYEVCRRLQISPAVFSRSLKRIEARAAEESDDAGMFYERALKKRQERINISSARSDGRVTSSDLGD